MDNCIFCKIATKQIPSSIVYEDDALLAFKDINPAAPVHLLVIPKGEYVSAADFNASAPPDALTGFYRAVAHVAKLAGVADNGYRLICNIGADSRSEVPHFHVHILGGKKLGHLLGPPVAE